MRSGAVRWSLCAAIVAAAHGAAWYALATPRLNVDLDAGSPVVTLELTPVAAAPAPPDEPEPDAEPDPQAQAAAPAETAPPAEPPPPPPTPEPAPTLARNEPPPPAPEPAPPGAVSQPAPPPPAPTPAQAVKEPEPPPAPAPVKPQAVAAPAAPPAPEPAPDAAPPPPPRPPADNEPPTVVDLPPPPPPPRQPAIATPPLTHDLPPEPAPPPPSAPSVASTTTADIASAPAEAPGREEAVSPAALRTWRQALIAQIERHKQFPKGASGQSGVSSVAFTIDRGGRITVIRLVASSGSAALDQASLDLIRRAEPFPAPPAGLGANELSFVTPIRYLAPSAR